MAWMELEREAIVMTARSADPEGLTLCAGWTTRHLLAHLVERERRPLRWSVDMISRREPGNERFMSQLVDGARSPVGYQALIDRFAQGAPRWSPLTWTGDRAHLLEYVLHHEDIRRGGAQPAAARELPAGQLRAIWEQLISASRLLLRGSPVGVALEAPGRPSQVVRKGGEVVTLTGDPVELVLQVFGRGRAAEVEITGPPVARAQFRAWSG